MGKGEKILLIDDEEEMLEVRKKMLRDLGYECIAATDGIKALDMIKKERPDVVLSDIRMPMMDGMQILKATKDIDPEVMVILFTGYSSIRSAVEAIKAGAFDYIPKPFSIEQLDVAIKRALDQKKLLQENRKLRSQIIEEYSFDNVIGKSDAMKKIFEKVVKAAKVDANVLIYGETGTGKELIARSIHAHSNRKEEAFVPVDCSALPENLLESELFGYERGAFTGAYATKHGLLEFANQGTFFLDEVCELGINLQTKFLRVLQERQLRRIGGKELIDVDIRVIAATNKNPQKALRQGTLREDLYYRLNVIPINLPPLRQRKEDIPLLAHHFIKQFVTRSDFEMREISLQAMQCLLDYPWPGNVRELQNVLEGIISLCDKKTILPSDLPNHIRNCRPTIDFDNLVSLPLVEARKKFIEKFEREFLQKLLQKNKGNISKVAKEARVSRRTIYRLLKHYKLN